MGGDATYDTTADALYALPPEEFTAARTAAVKAARATGDRELAKRLQELRRPTVVAWLANQLVRAHRDETAELVALGDRLREATGALDRQQVKALASEQQRLVRSLVQQAYATAGRRAGGDAQRGLEDTLRAALADPEAATRLMAGRLVDGLQHSGFPEVPLGPADVVETRARSGSATSADREGGALAPPGRIAPPGAPVSGAVRVDTAELDAAEAALARARSEEAAAERTRSAAVAADEAARDAVDDAQAQLARLREEVRAATALLAAAERDAAASRAALGRVRREAAAATRRRETAERRLARLAGGTRAGADPGDSPAGTEPR